MVVRPATDVEAAVEYADLSNDAISPTIAAVRRIELNYIKDQLWHFPVIILFGLVFFVFYGLVKLKLSLEQIWIGFAGTAEQNNEYTMMMVFIVFAPLLINYVWDYVNYRYFSREVDDFFKPPFQMLILLVPVFVVLTEEYDTLDLIVSFCLFVPYFMLRLFHRSKVLQLVKSIKYQKLLFLRVFESAKHLNSSMQNVIRFWRYFGVGLTFVDRPYYNQYLPTRWLSAATFVAFIQVLLRVALFALIGLKAYDAWDKFLLLDFDIAWIWENWWVIALWTGYVFWIQYFLDQLKEWLSVKDKVRKMEQKLSQRRKRKFWSVKYPIDAISSRAKNWQQHLELAVSHSDKVIMDLRGLKDYHHGCEFEIRYLLDHFPFANVVFWIENEQERSYFQSLLDQFSKSVYCTSPNIPVATVKMFVGTGKKWDDANVILSALQ